ncbi:phosphotransferase [Oxalicibacterium flavum]|uniref:Phosphotransferase n=1 Tax=Oxalicibacterium flavum TaxID=179467 RepID=A0A8J2XY37_9BURK|nr:3-hydroxylacyl-ACP dehydratase [Oxalicibacterium flavum]GGC07342.1 phosphotransferase [Oxalicibacterium flavum]
MSVDRDWMLAHIPHQGSMCLLDHVAEWDAQGMKAVATSHLSPDNPLRADGRLGAANGIEYAAQAMAVHTALLGTTQADAAVAERPRAGFLASVRNTTLHVARLDDIGEALAIEVTLMHGEPNCILYQFAVRSASGRDLLDGRATVIIDATALDNR